MSLVLPSELVVDRVLPTVRAMLARRLDERGLTQRTVADHLGVSQAAVSKYLAGDAAVEPLVRDDPRTVAAVEDVAEGIESGAMDDYDVLAELLALVRDLEDRGPVCELHEREMPALDGLGCDLCVRGGDAAVDAERETLADVRAAARVLATTPGMARFVPNVGSNVAAALPDATDERDVAAIPGRIYTSGNRVEVPANPEFGASHHVATAVIAAAAVGPDVRAAVNVATDDELLVTAREAGLDALEFDASYEDRAERLRDRFAAHGSVPDLCFHRGAFGVEPVTYVFGESAVDAAERVAALVDA
jgi:predicted fused transcriptional regulator/phosphomethylpyrimidine kinase/predicted transcriptional regulator